MVVSEPDVVKTPLNVPVAAVLVNLSSAPAIVKLTPVPFNAPEKMTADPSVKVVLFESVVVPENVNKPVPEAPRVTLVSERESVLVKVNAVESKLDSVPPELIEIGNVPSALEFVTCNNAEILVPPV